MPKPRIIDFDLLAECVAEKLNATLSERYDSNHDRSDNRPENLEILTRREHSAKHYRERMIDAQGRFASAERAGGDYAGIS